MVELADKRLILYFSSKDDDEVKEKEKIKKILNRENLKFKEFDITQKFILYGHTFTYENSFILDYCENGHRECFTTPLLRAGKSLFFGEDNIERNIPYLKSVCTP